MVGDRPAEKGFGALGFGERLVLQAVADTGLVGLLELDLLEILSLVVLLVLLVKIDRVTEMWGKILWAAGTSNHEACRTPGPRREPTRQAREASTNRRDRRREEADTLTSELIDPLELGEWSATLSISVEDDLGSLP